MRPSLDPTSVPARLATAVSKEALAIPSGPIKFSALHKYVRALLDPDGELLTDAEIRTLIFRVGVIPHRVILRCLVVMGIRARYYKNSALILRVRQLDASYRRGLLQLPNVQPSEVKQEDGSST